MTSNTVSTRRLVALALLLVVGGLATVLGSFGTWNACPHDPCGEGGGVTVILEQSGVQFGAGVATAIMGAVMAIAGLMSRRQRWRDLAIAVATVSAIGTFAVLALHMLIEYVIRNEVLSAPYGGFFLTLLGGVVGLTAALGLRRLSLLREQLRVVSVALDASSPQRRS